MPQAPPYNKRTKLATALMRAFRGQGYTVVLAGQPQLDPQLMEWLAISVSGRNLAAHPLSLSTYVDSEGAWVFLCVLSAACVLSAVCVSVYM